MTKKLLLKLIIGILIYLFIKYALPLYTTTYEGTYFHPLGSNQKELHEIGLARLVSMYFLCVALCFLIVAICIGDLDNWFEKHTDPHLKKFCDWVHRRNGGCN